jgi:hypothetical protein
MGFSTNFPAIKPSLLLDFANTKALDPRITFTRATTATYYDGVTTAKAEENLSLYSEDFSTWWSPVSTSVTANTTAAPNGATTADSLNSTATSAACSLTSPIAGYVGVNGQPLTISVYAKANTSNFLQIYTAAGIAVAHANFDISSGTAGNVGGTGVTSAITSVGNGWYRCSMSISSAGAAGAYFFALIDSGTAARAASYTGTIGTGIFLWGAQTEIRSAATAYTATTTQAITNYIPALQTAAAGVPRFDHNPITDESLGLLIEEQRTNLLTYSEQFDNAAWSKIRTSITANNIVAPDGTLTGDVLIENTDNNSHVVLTTVASQAAGTYTYSVYAKANGRTSFILQNTVTTTYGVLFDLSAVTATTNAGGATGTITHVGNGWYRCTATFTTATNIALSFSIQLISGGAGVYTGNGFSGIFLWGAQLEAGAFPTSYIPTVAASVTRNADAASMTGTNFSSWYSAAEGTIYGEASSATSNNGAIAVASDGTTANSFSIGHNGTSTTANINTNGSLQANFPSLGTWNINTFAKIAMAVGVNNSNAALNGSLGTTDTSCLMPVVNRMDIGSWVAVSSVQPINGTIKKIAYYPIRVTNAHLQGLTTV